MNSRFSTPLVLSVLALSGSLACAQISITAPGSVTANMDGNLAGFIRYVGPGTSGPCVAEPTSWTAQGETGRWAFLSGGAVAFSNVAQPSDNPFATPFTSDSNNNAATDNRFDIFQMGVVTSPAGGEGNMALRFNEGPWNDALLVFKVDNNSGAAIDQWEVTLDTWFRDTNQDLATLRLATATSYTAPTGNGTSYALGGSFSVLESRAGTKANAGLSALDTIGGPVAASVPNGGSLFVAVFFDVAGGGGTEFIIDNFTVTANAVPEPGWAAGLAGVLVLGLALRRRR